MKTVFYVSLGVAFGIMFALGAILKLFTMAAKVDIDDPGSVAKYRTNFETRCVSYLTDEMKRASEAPDYQEEAMIKLVCACDAKEMVRIMKRNRENKLVRIDAKTALSAGTPEMKTAFGSCAAAYGLKL